MCPLLRAVMLPCPPHRTSRPRHRCLRPRAPLSSLLLLPPLCSRCLLCRLLLQGMRPPRRRQRRWTRRRETPAVPRAENMSLCALCASMQPWRSQLALSAGVGGARQTSMCFSHAGIAFVMPAASRTSTCAAPSAATRLALLRNGYGGGAMSNKYVYCSLCCKYYLLACSWGPCLNAGKRT